MAQVMETDQFLEHYGVKGMKWGVRKADDSGGGKSSGGKKTSGVKSKIGSALDKAAVRDSKIDAARARQTKRETKVKTNFKQAKADTKAFSKERRVARKVNFNAKMDLLNHPDAVTANRMKSGEIMAALLWDPYGANQAKVGVADAIARRQASGYYERKKKAIPTASKS